MAQVPFFYFLTLTFIFKVSFSIFLVLWISRKRRETLRIFNPVRRGKYKFIVFPKMLLPFPHFPGKDENRYSHFSRKLFDHNCGCCDQTWLYTFIFKLKHFLLMQLQLKLSNDSGCPPPPPRLTSTRTAPAVELLLFHLLVDRARSSNDVFGNAVAHDLDLFFKVAEILIETIW